MIPFLALTAFALSAWLLFDLVAGVRRSRETQQERWQRAMSVLSTHSSGQVTVRPPAQRSAPEVESRPEGRPGRFDVAA